jgi:hypothetical protein
MPLVSLARRLAEPRFGVYWVLLASGLLGFRVGMIAYPAWQVAVEPAQVVAGLVRYPDGNPYYMYETKLWTILHQINALFLLAGVSEITLSRVISGILGMAGFQALSMVVYAFSRDVLLSIGAAVLIFFTRASSNGGTYPIDLVGTQHTYGSLGLSNIVLSAALLGSGAYRAGLFLLGLAPSLHPSLGAALWVIAAVAGIWEFSSLERRETLGRLKLAPTYVIATLRGPLKYFIAGTTITVASLLYHLAFTVDVPNVSTDAARPYVSAFMSFWDGHRAPVAAGSGPVAINRIVLAVAFVWLLGFSRQLPREALLLLRMAFVSAVLSLIFVALSWVPVDRMPLTLMILMPTRIVNFNGMAVCALLIGLLGAYRRTRWAQTLMLLLFVALLFTGRSMFWRGRVPDDWFLGRHLLNPLLLFQIAFLAAFFLALRTWHAQRVTGLPSPPALPALPALVPRAALVALLLWLTTLTLPLRASTAFYRDRGNDPFFAAIAAEKDGLVLTAGSYELIQLYTRRPVLLGGSLDIVSYVPEVGPELHRILLDVYGTDLFKPPEEARGRGVLPREAHRAVWEGYTRERWLEIGRTYDVTQVVTPIDWKLDLPLEIETRWRLYRIPRT